MTSSFKALYYVERAVLPIEENGGPADVTESKLFKFSDFGILQREGSLPRI